ncbi:MULTISPECIES: 2OG-Fe dioxygenase family protein [unclassified Pseudomonas]|uniref:2OG-Fe dioxygenase family protein n=1 Tax=unclassified Pseudomonas TaxID=196821 RepID=UPI001CBC7DDD|nr:MULTISPECIES: 2OG-Fe dioxygenase family protein [unclassified Pseudomonas]
MHKIDTLESISEDITRQGWAYRRGAVLAQHFNLNLDNWESFVSHWENLSLDEHMPDGGAYRYRRFSEFSFRVGSSSTLHKLPHAPYEKAKHLPTLNGGMARQFLPLEDEMVKHPFFLALLTDMAKIFDRAVGTNCDWNIRLHPYRVATDEFEQGKPTPEGRHRDGVHYLVMILIARVGVTGGMTRISSPLNETLCMVSLLENLDMIFGDDQRVMHEVSPIDCTEIGVEGYRDTLVIDFTRADKSQTMS